MDEILNDGTLEISNEEIKINENKYELLETIDFNIFRIKDKEENKNYIVLKSFPKEKLNIYEELTNKNKYILNYDKKILSCDMFLNEKNPDDISLLFTDNEYLSFKEIKKTENKKSLLTYVLKLSYIINSINMNGYVFLNFSPEKFLVNKQGEIFVYDLRDTHSQNIDLKGIFNHYTAPEVRVIEDSLEAVSDVFGIGCLTYEIIYEKSLEYYDSYELQNIINKDVKPYIIQLFSKTLSWEKEYRFNSILGFSNSLREVINHMDEKDFEINIGFFSTVGLNPNRPVDEDSAGFITRKFMSHSSKISASVFCVADGMGGGSFGEVASKIASETFLNNVFFKLKDIICGKETVEKIFRESIVLANETVLEKAREIKAPKKMGSTLVGGVIIDNLLYIVNVGDSRGYLFTDDGFRQITDDHSYVNYLMKEKGINEEEALSISGRNILAKVLGTESIPLSYPDYFGPFELNNSDKIFFCCDGVWNALSEEQIKQFLIDGNNTYLTAKQIVEAAMKEDGSDNITAMVLEFNTNN